MTRPSRSRQPAAPGHGSSHASRSNRSKESTTSNRDTQRLLNNRFEQQAGEVAESVAQGRPAWSAEQPLSESPTIRLAAKEEPAAEPKQPVSKGLLAADEGTLQRGQMRKSEFLPMLRESVCAAADAAMAATGNDTDGCPWIDYWFSYYEGRDAAQFERAILKYAPEASSVTSAKQYIPIITARVRRAVNTWARTGEITGVPEEMPAAMPGGDMLSAFGGMFFKAGPGGPREADPASVRQQLGKGEALPGDVRSRMESAFGTSFSGVRLHADSTGASLSSELNARAFTVGEHVAFGAGEFQPGTIAGDALIAHELAHVVQQGGASHHQAMGKSEDGESALEADADQSAFGAVSSLWSEFQGSVAPAIRSGLRLQRCKSSHEEEVERLGNKQYAFMEAKRKKEEERLKKEAEEEAKKKGLEPPKETPKVEVGDVIKKETNENALKGGPTTEWDTADQPAWKARAAAAWAAVLVSVKGTELEDIAKGVTFNFDPVTALTKGYYAWQNGKTLSVGMSWVRFAEQDPKNVWENLAHEMAGHFEYGQTYLDEIMKAAMSKLSDADRKKYGVDSQDFFETYKYPETEIYASLWQRRYRVPEKGAARPSGGIHPDDNILIRLKTMQKVLEPTVAKAVLKELKRRVDANAQILQRDKDFYVAKVKEVFGYNL